MANPNQEPRKNRPEVQPPPVPSRNLPEHEVQADKEGHREYHAEKTGSSPAEKKSSTTGKTLEPAAPGVHEEAAP
ncbi:MAG TPA: hypothetical protein PL182_02090 [Pseudobdellovibrionaceae bacterium]|nr:hypothetical protein [Pseudobdellovibrionaceae bacterium]